MGIDTSKYLDLEVRHVKKRKIVHEEEEAASGLRS